MNPRMLKVYGPYKVPFTRQSHGSGKMIEGKHMREFAEDLPDRFIMAKQGCYIFALRAGRGATPWYIGKSGKSFRQECFTPHKLNKYNRALFEGKRGTPVLYFVALPGQKKKISAKIITEVETYLIGIAKAANPKLLNVSKTKPPKWGILGVVRSRTGKPSATETAFRKMMCV